MRGTALVDTFHVNPALGQRMLLKGVHEFSGSGMDCGAGELTRPAGEALFYFAVNTFHE
jgi:hypothetical protein